MYAATNLQVKLNPSPGANHPSLQHWYNNMEHSKAKIFPAADYLTKREIPAQVAFTERDTPVSWRAQRPRKHTTTLGIYTDGSLTTTEDGTTKCGSGIYLPNAQEGIGYTFDGPQTVFMAELIAILKAVTHEASRGETGRHIYTDSLNLHARPARPTMDETLSTHHVHTRIQRHTHPHPGGSNL